ncbi:piggyBac transposable element-derived protein 3 [Trichonephila clavipes]|nr:piggyBac transposable element-derived protein 3 [Trichonephila clavipes]
MVSSPPPLPVEWEDSPCGQKTQLDRGRKFFFPSERLERNAFCLWLKHEKILKYLSGRDWDSDASTLRITCTVLVRPVLEYGYQIFQVASPTNLKKLERVQLSTARIITDLRYSCPSDLVLYEADIQPLTMRFEANSYRSATLGFGYHFDMAKKRILTHNEIDRQMNISDELRIINRNIIPNSKIPTEKVFNKMERRDSMEFVGNYNDVEISVTDNKTVIMAPTFAGEKTLGKVMRYDKTKNRVEIIRPHVIEEYNKHMGGVDLLYGIIARHKILVRSKK